MTMLITQVPHCTYAKLKNKQLGTEIVSMSYVIFEHTKGTDNVLADSISHLRSMHLYDSLDLEGGGKDFGHDIL